MLRNSEDYDLESESGEENRPSRHSRAHANIRVKSCFKNESDKLYESLMSHSHCCPVRCCE